MEPQARTYLLNMLLAFVPDLVVGWIAARLTDSGWYGFFITLIVLQAIYFFFWFKNALWAWLLFWIYGKQQVAAHLEKWFIDSHLPVPSKYATDLDDYLSEVSNNEALDANTRVKAAHELGTLNGYKGVRKISLLLQINLASKIAMKRYARREDKSSLARTLDSDKHTDDHGDDHDKELQIMQNVRSLCQLTTLSAQIVKERDRNDPNFDKAHKSYLRRKLQVVDLARSIKDEFYLSAALHAIIELCLAAGEIADAKQLVSSVKVDFIREKILEEHVELSRL